MKKIIFLLSTLFVFTINAKAQVPHTSTQDFKASVYITDKNGTKAKLGIGTTTPTEDVTIKNRSFSQTTTGSSIEKKIINTTAGAGIILTDTSSNITIALLAVSDGSTSIVRYIGDTTLKANFAAFDETEGSIGYSDRTSGTIRYNRILWNDTTLTVMCRDSVGGTGKTPIMIFKNGAATNNEKARMTADGRFGLGVAPLTTLDVNGSTLFRGSVAFTPETSSDSTHTIAATTYSYIYTGGVTRVSGTLTLPLGTHGRVVNISTAASSIITTLTLAGANGSQTINNGITTLNATRVTYEFVDPDRNGTGIWYRTQ